MPIYVLPISTKGDPVPVEVLVEGKTPADACNAAMKRATSIIVNGEPLSYGWERKDCMRIATDEDYKNIPDKLQFLNAPA